MNSVLISIHPTWCDLILLGKKIVELRKTMPKLKTPFKVYIYCTDGYVAPTSSIFSNGLRKKVIGEFICDKIMCRTLASLIVKEDAEATLSGTCLTKNEVLDYLKYQRGTSIYECKNNTFYLWHISDLVIYDEPKELDEFSRKDKSGNIQTIKRPPQSWCYIEELKKIDFNNAIELAKTYYHKKGQYELTKVYETEHVWIIYAREKDKLKFGNVGISIEKKTGEIASFILPSKANFEILKTAKLTELNL